MINGILAALPEEVVNAPVVKELLTTLVGVLGPLLSTLNGLLGGTLVSLVKGLLGTITGLYVYCLQILCPT